MRKSLLVAPLILCMASLSACSSLTTAGIVSASQLNPLETDPSVLKTAIGTSDAIRLRTGDAKVLISYSEKGAEQPVVSEEFTLAISPADAASKLSPAPNERIYLASFSEDDLARVRDAQSRIKALKTKGNGEGSLEVSIKSGCLERPMPAKLLVRTFLFNPRTSSYVALTEPQDFLTLLPEDQLTEFRKNLPAC